MSILLDTNILLYLIKGTNRQSLYKKINPQNERVYLSIVSVGEIKTIALTNGWGKSKQSIMGLLLNEVPILEINESLVETYTQIDAFSQCRNPAYPEYPFKPPRNMGKNDLWIAATAALLGLKLVTTDADFNHLHNVFIEVERLKPELLRDNNG